MNVVYICVPTVSKALKSSEKGLSHPAISDRFDRGKLSIDVWTLTNIYFGQFQWLFRGWTKLEGTKDLLKISFWNCLHLLCRSINPQRSSEFSWPNPSISDIRPHEEPILLNANIIRDIFGTICKASLWNKHMQKQEYCCWAQNRALFADIDILAEKQIQDINR